MQERRGVYAVSRKATIPLLVITAAAVDITENKQQVIQESDERNKKTGCRKNG